MKPQFNLVLAEGAQRMLQMNLLFIQRDLKLVLQFVGNGTGSNGTEHLAIFAGLDLDVGGELGNALGEFAHAVELMRFALGPALTEGLEPAFICTTHGNGEALRIKIIAGVASS